MLRCKGLTSNITFPEGKLLRMQEYWQNGRLEMILENERFWPEWNGGGGGVEISVRIARIDKCKYIHGCEIN